MKELLTLIATLALCTQTQAQLFEQPPAMELKSSVQNTVKINGIAPCAIVPAQKAEPLSRSNSAPKLKAPIPEGKARITFVNEMEFGMVYQLLIDADATAYGNEISLDPKLILNGDYSCFEYKLPTNASYPDFQETSLTQGVSASIDIPEGIYDMAIVTPMADAPYWLIYGGTADDYKYEAGKEYRYRVFMDYASYSMAVELTILAPYDLAVKTITIPGERPFGNSEKIVTEVTNLGTAEWTAPYTVNLSINGQALNPINANNASIASGESVMHEFTYDLSTPAKYVINASVDTEADLNPNNNSITGAVFQQGSLTPPVNYDFENMLDEAEWTILDLDGDNQSWKFTTTYIDTNPDTFAHIDYGWKDHNDYLITTYPVALPAGDAHLVFDIRAGQTGAAEKCEVLYGTSPDPAKMTRIWANEKIANTEFKTAVKGIKIDQAGDYYFAFHAYTEAWQKSFDLNNVIIGSGDYAGNPDAILEVLLPEPTCNMSATQPIQVRVTNEGTADISSATISYTLNGGAEYTQNFNFSPVVSNSESAVVTFDQTANLSALGAHAVTATISNVVSRNGYVELAQDNNTATTATTHLPVVSLPYKTDYKGEAGSAAWASKDNAWKHDGQIGLLVGDDNNNLYSAAMQLTKGKEYRLEMIYRIGTQMGFNIAGSYKVLLMNTAKPDQPVELGNFEREYFETLIVREITIIPTEDGVYQLVIVPAGFTSTMGIRSLNVVETPDYEVRVLSLTAPSQLPVKQAGSFQVQALVVNTGTKETDVEVDVQCENKSIGALNIPALKSHTGGNALVPVSLDGAAVGEQKALAANLNVPAHANAVTMVPSPVTMNISNTTLAWDHIEGTPNQAIMLYEPQQGANIGSWFFLNTTDVLKGITIGWANIYPSTVTINLFKYDPYTNKIGDNLLTMEEEKGETIGWTTYPVTDTELTPGVYIASVVTYPSNIAADYVNGGAIYWFNSVEEGLQVYGYCGAPAIRLEFAQDEGGIASVEADVDADAVYYNLQGVRVSNPTTGVYIKVQGQKATKVYLK